MRVLTGRMSFTSPIAMEISRTRPRPHAEAPKRLIKKVKASLRAARRWQSGWRNASDMVKRLCLDHGMGTRAGQRGAVVSLVIDIAALGFPTISISSALHGT